MRPLLSQRLAIAEACEEFPGLGWLAEPLSAQLDFVREMRGMRPKLVLRCAGVVGASALLVRHHRCPADAFTAANLNRDGQLSVGEFSSAAASSAAAGAEGPSLPAPPPAQGAAN